MAFANQNEYMSLGFSTKDSLRLIMYYVPLLTDVQYDETYNSADNLYNFFLYPMHVSLGYGSNAETKL